MEQYKSGKQVQQEIIRLSREALKAGASRREEALSNPRQWQELRNHLLNVVKSAFPEEMFHRDRPLKARVVSRHEFEHFRVENVLFESLPGWEVNGSLYLPKEPGKYPGIVCPTGHSTKTGVSYQTAAQTFARNGFAALSFDPPGCVGEKQACNDHFTNGLIGYLTGYWSQTHFVVDALSCMDYLETREDIDSTHGFAMTGVSGGGLTTFFSAMVDERVKVSAPVCCLSEHELLHLQDLYTSCPEQFGHRYIAEGIDFTDYLAIAAPTPLLIVAGKYDEVFDYRSVERIYQDTRKVYELLDSSERCDIFIDEHSGHEYSVAMASRVVEWINRHLLGIERQALALTSADIVRIEAEKLYCHPSSDTNMITINRAAGEQLQALRTENALQSDKVQRLAQMQQAASRLLGIDPAAIQLHKVTEQQEPPVRWAHELCEVDIEPEAGIHVPGLLMRRAKRKEQRSPAVLFIDEAGKWNALRQQRMLAKAGGFLQREELENEPIVLSVDVSGFGELTMDPTAYDLASWNDIERVMTYLSIAAGRPLMGLRVRDALAALRYLQQREDVDPSRIIVGGAGIGAIVAWHVALLDTSVKRVIAIDSLSHYGAMLTQFPFTWQQSIVIPDVLKAYDLPELANVIPAEVVIISPRDAARDQLSQSDAEKIYGSAALRQDGSADGVRVYAEHSAQAAEQAAIAAIRQAWS